MYSQSIDKLIAELKKLPSVGQHTAERYVFHWLARGKRDVADFVLSLKGVMDNVKSCEQCWNFTDTSPCQICADPKRDQTLLCVVADSQSVVALQKSGFNGVYHVLRGVLDATDPEGFSKIKIKQLFDRTVKDSDLLEIILALNPDLSGETTMMYLEKELHTKNPKIKISRLARGLPSGSDLQYADDITLESALKNRR
ncbi:MAG: recombination protein RecR [Candidatus Magasanikbacteria bacterium RIFOXYD2_FULL_41_14]|uniref:Recombination protein RecR n=1 Tax=Candidatus Magasanikbacteria bacterium RIFOXYD2_FULL_41_14 TaxID=1798709 RepID=A0A1F6PCT1_9BACT|nr:MAG: recombination protein RecR [Candidatus Magasanikbacteria bacterium RIFOXYD2_FULL_41_14]